MCAVSMYVWLSVDLCEGMCAVSVYVCSEVYVGLHKSMSAVSVYVWVYVWMDVCDYV